jgi:hypothetical protein
MVSAINISDVLNDAERSIPPLTGLSAVSGTTAFDPAAVVRQIFGVDFALSDRNRLIAQIDRALPIETGVSGKPVIQLQRDPAASPGDGAPSVGPTALPAFAAQILQKNASLFSEIKPFASIERKGCDFQNIVPLATITIDDLVEEFSTPEPPLQVRVDTLLGMLCGYKPGEGEPKPLTLQSVTGHLGVIRDRCGLDAGKACSVDDEKVLTAFSNIVTLVNSLVQTWDAARKSDADQFIGVGVYPLQRNLSAIVSSLTQLRDLVPSSVWITAEVQSSPRVIAWDFYQWIYQYASVGAVRDLRAGGKDAVCVVAGTFLSINELFEKTFVAPATGAVPCAGIAAFADGKVKDVLNDLSCHLQRVIEVARDLAGNQTCLGYGWQRQPPSSQPSS